MRALTRDQDVLALLGRPLRARLMPADRRAFVGSRVMITGAGGTIGSALARDIASCNPARLGLIDHSEYNLVRIERDIRTICPTVDVVPCLVDVTRPTFVRRAFARVQPTVVYHAAAYKHVTAAEQSIAAAAGVNVLGTSVVVDAAEEARARFVLISSDKAASPTSIMGATKRLAELVTLTRVGPAFPAAVVRFGNVIGSSGSLLEIIETAIRSGQPIPVTDPDATRYFMTATEAVALVVRAGRSASGTAIFWLDMGQPIRIGDLVDRAIARERRLSGRDVPVEIIGLRPGEKRHEQLVDHALAFQPTPDRRILRAPHPPVDRGSVRLLLRRLMGAFDRADDGAALDLLVEALPGFTPSAYSREQAEGGSRALTVSARSVA